jgi:hypothetical protein
LRIGHRADVAPRSVRRGDTGEHRLEFAALVHLAQDVADATSLNVLECMLLEQQTFV